MRAPSSGGWIKASALGCRDRAWWSNSSIWSSSYWFRWWRWLWLRQRSLACGAAGASVESSQLVGSQSPDGRFASLSVEKYLSVDHSMIIANRHLCRWQCRTGSEPCCCRGTWTWRRGEPLLSQSPGCNCSRIRMVYHLYLLGCSYQPVVGNHTEYQSQAFSSVWQKMIEEHGFASLGFACFRKADNDLIRNMVIIGMWHSIA